MRKIDEIIVHCDASDMDAHDTIDAIHWLHTAAETEKIRWGRYLTYGKAFDDTGYHLFIQRSGSAQIGRPIETPGAHCRGHNTRSLGICVHGDKHFTPRQKDALVKWLKHYLQIFDLRPSDVYGHYEKGTSGKTCPNMYRDEIRALLIEP